MSETRASAASTVEAAASRADRTGRAQPVALRTALPACDPLALLAAPTPDDAFVFDQPSRGFALAARGSIRSVEARGPERFGDAARQLRALFAELRLAGDPGPPEAGPLAVGGFGFADEPQDSRPWRAFPSLRFVLPELLVVRRGDSAWCSVAREIAPGANPGRELAALQETLEAARRALAEPPSNASEPRDARYTARSDRPHADYRARVAAALRRIAFGELEKVVLARRVRLGHAAGFEPLPLLEALRSAHPSCTSFAVVRPGAAFVGATPECLVRLRARRIETTALAGSAPRGRTPEEDERLGRALRESKKEQAEHASVVRALVGTLAPRCDALRVPEAPRLRRIEGIQHLETLLSGVLRRPGSVLELAGLLHPTPAVGGAPREASIAWLAENEDLDRGWYAGAVGFVDAESGGELAVALRSALLAGPEAYLYAGAGIVAGSEPEAELRETRLKLRALLAPLLEI